mmetsp:Transcript_26669/g.75326  ORF Transcript_26669/g.75326 Transcript_26669/m.75326 type:complete len:349 (+) Transcript_26669:552-1598(+)
MKVLASSRNRRDSSVRWVSDEDVVVPAHTGTPRNAWNIGWSTEFPQKYTQHAVSSQVSSCALPSETKGLRRRNITVSVRESLRSKWWSKWLHISFSQDCSAFMQPTTPGSFWSRMATWPVRIAATASRAFSWRTMCSALYHSSSGLARKRQAACTCSGALAPSSLRAQLPSTSSANSSRGGRPTERATTLSGLSMHAGTRLCSFLAALHPAATWVRVVMRCSLCASDMPRRRCSSSRALSLPAAASTWARNGPSAAQSAGSFVARLQSSLTAPCNSSGRLISNVPFAQDRGSRDSRPCWPSTLQNSLSGNRLTSCTFMAGQSSVPGEKMHTSLSAKRAASVSVMCCCR